MLDLSLRVVKEKILSLFLSSIPSFITPNQLTTVSFIFGIICIYTLSFNHTWISLCCWTLNRFFDGIDGKI